MPCKASKTKSAARQKRAHTQRLRKRQNENRQIERLQAATAAVNDSEHTSTDNPHDVSAITATTDNSDDGIILETPHVSAPAEPADDSDANSSFQATVPNSNMRLIVSHGAKALSYIHWGLQPYQEIYIYHVLIDTRGHMTEPVGQFLDIHDDCTFTLSSLGVHKLSDIIEFERKMIMWKKARKPQEFREYAMSRYMQKFGTEQLDSGSPPE
ncbi:hypothetical protein F4782DRAFT_529839 [Xylaria castorea]|nr:hypothetical protein F4782DRAFT_529839 [Xylaria castorea]